MPGLQRPRPDWKEHRAGGPQIGKRRSTILAIHSGALGDCILFGHLLSQLDGEVTVVAGGSVGQLLAGAGVVGRAIDFHGLPMHEVFSDRPLDDCRLPDLLGGHDRLISCFAGGNSLAEGRLAAMCRARSAAFLPVRPPEDATCHLVDLWGDMLGLPAGVSKGVTAWQVPQAWREDATAALRQARVHPSGKYVVLHPGAGAEAKCWPVDRYMELAQRFDQAVWVLGPVEADRWPATRRRLLTERFCVLDCPELKTLAGVLAESAAFVGNDSGVAHLAAATGAPTLALFGPTRPEQFAPLGPAARAISAEPIEKITVQQVVDALADLVDLG